MRVVELERQLVAKCLGEAPVYFRDQRDRAVAIVTRLVGWATDDMSAGDAGDEVPARLRPGRAGLGPSGAARPFDGLPPRLSPGSLVDAQLDPPRGPSSAERASHRLGLAIGLV